MNRTAPISSPFDRLFLKDANLGDQVYGHLRDLILSRQFPGGIALPEGKLAERLKVSRTPMREALVRLVGEGLLERTNDRAYRVRAVSTREFFECMQLRELLECFAIDKAIPVLTDDKLASLRARLREVSETAKDDMPHWTYDNHFHGFFALAAGYQALADSITRMRLVARLFRISSPFHRIAEIDSEHLAIIEAAERRDAEATKAAMLVHLRNLQDDVRLAIARETDPSEYFR